MTTLPLQECMVHETDDNIKIDKDDYDNHELDTNEIGDIVPEVKHHKQHEDEDDEEYPKDVIETDDASNESVSSQ